MPALSGNFSLLSVKNMYGNSSRPSPDSMTTYYADIIGSPVAGDSLTDFAGYGTPDLSAITIATSSTLGGKIDIDYTIDCNQLTSYVQAQYQLDDGQVPEEANWTNVGSLQSHASNTTNSYTITLPAESESYYIRLLHYNKFNDHVNDHSGKITYWTRTSSAPANDPLQLSNLTLIYTDGTTKWEFFWDYPSSTGSFTLEWKLNSGSFTTTNVTLATLTYEGSNRWSATFQPNQLLQSGDTVQFRIKRAGTTEPWTTTTTYNQGTSIIGTIDTPAVSTSSATNVGSNSATLRLSISSFDGYQDESYNYWWEYKVQGAGSWSTTPQTSSTTTGTKTRTQSGLSSGTTYEFRGKAQHNYETGTTNTQTGSTLTFTTTVSQEVTNFSAIDFGFSHNLSWSTPAAGNPTNYEIQYDDGFWNTLDNNVSGSATQYSHSNPPSGITQYRIRANYSGTYGDWVYATLQ